MRTIEQYPQKSPEASPDLAHRYAVSVVGPDPRKYSQEHWDRYYDAYYDYLDGTMSAYLDEGRTGRESSIAHSSVGDEFDRYVDEPVPQNPGRGEKAFLTSMRKFFDALRGEPLSSSKQQKQQPAVENYLFFKYAEERRDVFEFSKAIAEYLRKERIKNLVIVDRSSRPLYIGVIEYWRKAFPNQKRPEIYFVNPKGFRSKEVSSRYELSDVNLKAALKEDLDEPVEHVRSRREIADEFKTRYSRLFADRKQSVLIFDTCIHSGDTLASVVATFKEMGFADVRVGSVNPADRKSRARADFYITDKDPEKGCYPFDRDRLIEKTFEHVYSRPTQNALKRVMSFALRREIKKIMQEYPG